MKTSALLLGSTTVGTTTQTLAWPSELFPVNMYDSMDVVINVATLTGSNVTFSVQERFSGLGFIETANSGTISGTGTVFLVSSTQGITGTSSTVLAVSPMLGKGGEKQVVVTQGGTIGTISCSVYVIPYSL